MGEPTNLNSSRLLASWFASPKLSIANAEGEVCVERNLQHRCPQFFCYTFLLAHNASSFFYLVQLTSMGSQAGSEILEEVRDGDCGPVRLLALAWGMSCDDRFRQIHQCLFRSVQLHPRIVVKPHVRQLHINITSHRDLSLLPAAATLSRGPPFHSPLSKYSNALPHHYPPRWLRSGCPAL